MTATLRRGLPRRPGGDAWPPADVVYAGGLANGPVAAQPPAPPAVPAAPAVETGGRQPLRRGLPRVVGGEPWPPAGAVAAFAVAQVVEAEATVAAQDPAPPAEPTAMPAVASPTPPSPVGIGQAEAAPAPTRPAARFLPADVVGAIAAIAGAGLALAVVATAIVFAVQLFLFHSDAGTAFLTAFPGATSLPDWAPVGFPAWTQWQHWLNAFFLVLVVKTGWTVRTTKRPSAMWQPRSGKGKKISIELFVHLALDVLWLVNGVVFWVLLFATGQWVRVVPTSWAVFPNALSAGLQYVSLDWPTEDGWMNYNSLQVLAYFVTIFIAAPLAAITGFRMSPLWPAKAERLSKAYPMELARAIHFPVMLYFVLFVIVHVVLVLATGALKNLNHMFWGSDDPASWAGAGVFALGLAVIVAGWLLVRPFIVQQLGALVGRVGR